MIIAGVLIAVMMGVLGVAIKFGKQYWLIAGYNTMPKEKQKHVDIEGLGNFMGNWFFSLGALVLAGLYLSTRFSANLFPATILMFVAGIFYMVFKAQRFDSNERSAV